MQEQGSATAGGTTQIKIDVQCTVAHVCLGNKWNVQYAEIFKHA